jgi:hypothetical protein
VKRIEDGSIFASTKVSLQTWGSQLHSSHLLNPKNKVKLCKTNQAISVNKKFNPTTP